MLRSVVPPRSADLGQPSVHTHYLPTKACPCHHPEYALGASHHTGRHVGMSYRKLVVLWETGEITGQSDPSSWWADLLMESVIVV